MSSSPDSPSTGKVSGMSPHLNPRFSRIKQDYHKKLFNYEKELNLKTSKSTSREKLLRESMLAYTERIRSITNSRSKIDNDDSDNEENLPLVVRAKHIPKYPVKRNLPRRPASLDELIGKSSLVKQERERLLKRPRSASRVPPHVPLPSLPERLQGRSHHVKISFVSASDLYDFVDYSLRNRGTKKETLQFLKMEKDILTKKTRDNQTRSKGSQNRSSDFSLNHKKDNSVNTLPTLPPIDSKDFSESRKENPEINLKHSSLHNSLNENSDKHETFKTYSENRDNSPVGPLKTRPNRAKRMKIRQPDLGAIPENDMSSHRSRSETPDRTIISPPPKISPRNVNLESNLNSIPENDSSIEGAFHARKKLSRINNRKIDFSRTSPFGKIDSLFSNEKRIIDLDDLDIQSSSNKLKAQKKFKKLIFLRDIPDRK